MDTINTEKKINDANISISPIKRFFNMLKMDRKEIIIVYIYAIFHGLINLSLPLGIQAIIALVISREFSASWGILIFIVVLGVATAGTIQILQLYLTELLQRRIFTRASFEFAYRIPRFRMESVNNFYAPELMNRFFDTLNIQKGLPKILIDFSSSSLQILFGIILLSLYHPFFVFFGFLLIGLMVLIFYISGPRGLKTSILESKYKYQVAHWLEELARVMGTFKLAGESDLPINKMNYYVKNYLKFRKEHFKVLIFQFANIVGFKTIITAGLLILGSALVINQEINLGQFVAAEIIILLVLSSSEKLILTMETVYDVLTGLEKLGEVSDIPLEKEEGIDLNEISSEGGIALELSNLSYQFNDGETKALEDINLKIEKGEKICFVGDNQSGKSTLLSIISGLYHDYQGSILFNGIPFSNINIISFRSVIGDNLNLQDLFHGTLFENIAVGKIDVSLKDVLTAIEQVGLNDFFKNQSEGLNTMIKPEGQGLSDSVKQKIILARTLAEHPKIIVMDNALQGLDYDDRKRVSDILTQENAPWTLLTVTSDPLMLDKCDRIVTLAKGKIIEDKRTKQADKNA